jgi:hypothetical protein
MRPGSSAAKDSNLIAMSRYSAINFMAASLSHRVGPRNHTRPGNGLTFENLICQEAPTLIRHRLRLANRASRQRHAGRKPGR